MTFLLVCIATFLLVHLIAGPLKFYRLYRIQALPVLEPISSAAELSEPVRQFFNEGYHAFNEIGFTHLGTFSMPDASKYFRSLHAVYQNLEEKVHAETTAMFVNINGKWQLHGQFLEMTTHFEVGGQFQTANVKDLFVFPVEEGGIRTQHPELEKPAELFEAHKAIVKHYGNDRVPELKLHTKYNGNIPKLISEEIFEALSTAERAGLLRFKDSGLKAQPNDDSQDANPWQAPAPHAVDQSSVFVATLLGAFRIRWKTLWPFHFFVKSRRYARDRKILAKTGFRWPEPTK